MANCIVHFSSVYITLYTIQDNYTIKKEPITSPSDQSAIIASRNSNIAIMEDFAGGIFQNAIIASDNSEITHSQGNDTDTQKTYNNLLAGGSTNIIRHSK